MSLTELMNNYNSLSNGELSKLFSNYELDEDNMELYLFIRKLLDLKLECCEKINSLNHNMFANKTVLVTGGSSGIGKSIVDLYLRAGAKVIVFDIKKCNEHEGKVDYRRVDVRDRAKIDEATQSIDNLDILVTCAGLFDFDVNMDDDMKKQMVDVNIHGVENMCEACMPLLQKNNGQILTITSGLSKTIDPTSLLYCITKQEIIKLTEKYATVENGVRANSVLPGPIMTPLLVNAIPTIEELIGYGELNPRNMIGLPEWVALEVLRVTSNSEYNNYQSTEVDCGETSMSEKQDNKYWNPAYDGDYSFTINGELYKWDKPYTKHK